MRKELRMGGMDKLKREVKISDRFRGGFIHYYEGENEIAFEWEFGGGGVIAIISGARAQVWDARYPWAAGRQAEVYEFIAKEAIRQKSPVSTFEIDLACGFITIR